MRILLCFTALLLTNFSFAQSTWSLNEVAVGIGNQNDRVKDMSMDWMRTYAKSDEAFQLSLDGYDYNPCSEFMGTSLNVDLTFTQGDPMGNVSQELRVGARLITDREAMISFDREDIVETGTYQESLIFCLVDDELVWDIAYLVRKTGKHFSMYTGVAGNFGTTFSSKLLRIRNSSIIPEDIALGNDGAQEVENTTDVFSAKNAVFYRMQIPFGLEVHRNKWAFGPEFRIGVGGHSVLGGNSYLITPTTLFSMRLSYFPKR